MAEPARQSDLTNETPKPHPLAAVVPARSKKKKKPADLLAQPVVMNVGDTADTALASLNDPKLKLVDAPLRKKDPNSAVVTGLRDLQQLQKQTIAVLEAVKGNLEDIRQVLRSPEATRGMEKQQNAAALLAKGFAPESAMQARGAVELLPANPEAHLLLSLALAANQEFDDALGAARKGLALFDRRQHPLAIEAGLLHAISAMGHGGEAAQRWAEIIEGLPLPVLMDHIGRIAVCYPSAAPEGQLDRALARRMLLDRQGDESGVPMNCLFAGLDSCKEHKLGRAHRVVLLRINTIAKSLFEPSEIVRFLGDYVVSLAERNHIKTANAMANRCLKKLLKANADAPTLYRALLKMELASVGKPARYLARLLAHWRAVGARLRTRRLTLMIASLFLLAGGALFAHSATGMQLLPAAMQPIYIGLSVMGTGVVVALAALMGRSLAIELPYDRARLTADEIRFVRSREVKDTFKRVLRRELSSRRR